MRIEKLAKAAAAVAAFLLCAAPAAGVEREARPALWRLADADTTIYLFGTIHVLPPDLRWRTARIDEAIRSAQELVVESDLPEGEEGARLFLRLAMSPGLRPLAERVPEERRAALRALLERSPVPAAALDRLESWAAAIILLYANAERIGLAQESGVEQVLKREFAGRPISGLNRPEEHLGFLDGLSQRAQDDLLTAATDDMAEVRTEIEAMLAAWSAGDPEAIDGAFNDEEESSEELNQVLLVNRNRQWAHWLASRLDRPGTILVAVGAGHLSGPDSVQTMLESGGLRVERVQ